MASNRSASATPLESRDHGRAGEVLARAFDDDPLWAAVMPDPATRPRALIKMFSGLTKAVVAARGMAETTPEVDAVALWLPPGRDIGLRAMMASGFALPRFMMGLPAQERRLMMKMLRETDEKRKALMPDPHWYLSAIGVEPKRQGHGLGSLLVQSGISRAEDENSAIYLETETQSNVGFYESLGFDLIQEISPAGLGVPIWLMVRQPAR